MTYALNLGFNSLPKMTNAYMRRSNGQIYPLLMNQYGDSHQGNGALLDYTDGGGILYLRLPCSNSGGNNIMHFGSYANRTGIGSELIDNQTGLSVRIMVWN